MRELLGVEINLVSGSENVQPTVVVTGRRNNGASPLYALHAMQAQHADGGGGQGANIWFGQGGGNGEAETVDPIVVTPRDGVSDDDSNIYCEENGFWLEQDDYGNVWRYCVNPNGELVEEFVEQLWVS